MLFNRKATEIIQSKLKLPAVKYGVEMCFYVRVGMGDYQGGMLTRLPLTTTGLDELTAYQKRLVEASPLQVNSLVQLLFHAKGKQISYLQCFPAHPFWQQYLSEFLKAYKRGEARATPDPILGTDPQLRELLASKSQSRDHNLRWVVSDRLEELGEDWYAKLCRSLPEVAETFLDVLADEGMRVETLHNQYGPNER